MSKAAQLKKKAAEFEQKKQYDRALATYLQAIDAAAGNPDETDIPLYNRVGDLHFRLGDTDQALSFYEKAVDLYTEGGFFNNAIALCNKVLRHAPSRSSIYYKLGRISAKKGFNSDAKQNFLEYADRMQRAGKMDEAFRALKEFADLCPGQDDVRLMLAEQLSRVDRKDEALEQLQVVYDTMVGEDRTREAAATLERMRAIDPAFEPKQGATRSAQKHDGLVFIDINDDPDASAEPVSPVSGLEPTSLAPEPVPEAEVVPEASPPLAGLDTTLIFVPPETPEDEVQAVADGAPASDEFVEDPSAEAEVPAEEPLGEPLVLAEEAVEDAGALDEASPESLVDDDESAAFAKPVHAEQAEEPVVIPTPTDDELVDFAEWLRETESSDVEESDASANGFAQMLETFKQGVEESMADEDSDSHYDLGLAYKEMGLLAEAVAQFDRAIQGEAPPERRVRAYEALGECYLDARDESSALVALTSALTDLGLPDDKLVGVLYLLGYASERLDRWADASAYYSRVHAVDATFRDVHERLHHAAQAAGAE